MSMTDPIADLLTRIRNGHVAQHRQIEVPASKIKGEIVKILQDEGYIDGFEPVEGGVRSLIRIQLKYGPDGEKAISGIERVSRPGRRVYCGKGDIPKVLNGLGITIVSTSKGIFSGAACHKQGIGGEVLCSVW